MGEGDNEYEVESITQARVDRERGKKLCWKYCVRWKGYSAADDTWEPVASFAGSEDIIKRFWERANVSGRDFRDLSLFKPGEEFLPIGPPRRKAKRKSLKADAGESSKEESPSRGPNKGVPQDEKRRRSVSAADDSEDRPRKRIREDAPESQAQASSSTRTVKPMPLLKGKASSSSNRKPAGLSPGASRRQQKKAIRTSSFDEIIPASDDEQDETRQANSSGLSQHIGASGGLMDIEGSSESRTYRGNTGESSTLTNVIPPDEPVIPDNVEQADEFDPLFDVMGEDSTLNIAPHRARVAGPLVKMAEDPNLAEMDRAISVKARLLGRNGAPPPPTPSGSGPGRSSTGLAKKNTSSLLTFRDGSLRTVKGTYSKPEKKANDLGVVYDEHTTEGLGLGHGPVLGGGDAFTDDIPSLSVSEKTQAPPTATELLVLAGLDPQNSETLPDFEDDGAAVDQNPHHAQQIVAPQPELNSSVLQQSLALAKDKLFPSGATTIVMNTVNAAWRRSTIFGPLGLGSESSSQPLADTDVISQSTRSSPFSLSLDSSVSIPVVLTGVSHVQSGSPSLDFIVGNSGPPGKFYNQQAALALLNTLRTGGPSAKIVADTNATDDQIRHFDRFRTRLNAGELFVAMAGVEVLAFCSSDNDLISRRLNLSPMLLGNPGSVMVSRVIIENYSAYADAALDADSLQWSQYLQLDV